MATPSGEGGGAVVKTMGDGLLASFGDVTAAVQTALGLSARSDVSTRNRRLGLRGGLHRGPALAATINDHLDYFGTTSRDVHGLLRLAGNDELILSQAVAGDPEVAAFLSERQICTEVVPSDFAGHPHVIRVRPAGHSSALACPGEKARAGLDIRPLDRPSLQAAIRSASRVNGGPYGIIRSRRDSAATPCLLHGPTRAEGLRHERSDLDSTSDRSGRLQALIGDFLDAVQSGRPIDREALLAAHPDLADDLRAFLADYDQFQDLAAPLRDVAGAAADGVHRAHEGAGFSIGSGSSSDMTSEGGIRQRRRPPARAFATSATTSCCEPSARGAWVSSSRPASAASIASWP